MTLYVGSDNLLWLLGLTDEVTNTFVNGATVVATIINPDGSTLATVTLSYVAGPQTVNGVTYTDGCYRGQLPAATALIPQVNYSIETVATFNANVLTKVVVAGAAYDGAS